MVTWFDRLKRSTNRAPQGYGPSLAEAGPHWPALVDAAGYRVLDDVSPRSLFLLGIWVNRLCPNTRR